MMGQGKSDHLLIRGMRADDLVFAAECTANEGWQSENATTLEISFNYDPAGCFIAEQNGQKAGMCMATMYGRSGFIGELIVRPDARGRGTGAALLNQGVAYLKRCGAASIYLDGVLKAVELYERNGFSKVCRSWRFTGMPEGIAGENVRQMANHDLQQVYALDMAHFGEDRSFFLQRRLEIFPELAYVMTDGYRIRGFIMGRSGEGWISAGPCVVEKDAVTPQKLLQTFAKQAGNRPISLGVLDSNQQACEMMDRLGFTRHSDSPWRMVLGRRDDLGASTGCYAIGSAAKG